MNSTSLPPDDSSDALGPNRIRVGDHVAIFRKPNSKFWHVDYSVSGKQFRHSLKTSSKKQAVLLAKKKNAEVEIGELKDPAKRTTIITAIDKYLKAKSPRLDEQTIKTYRRDLLQFAAYARSRGVIRLDRVDAEILDDFQFCLKEKGMMGIMVQPKRGRKFNANKTVTTRGKMKTIRQLFRFAVNRGLINRDTAAGYELPPKSHAETFCWSRSEVQVILSHASPYWRERFRFLAATGLRSNEMCWLTKDDVKLIDGKTFVLIRKKKCPQTGRTWRPKHGRERKVPLCAAAAEIIRAAIAASPGPWVFWSTTTRSNQPGHMKAAVMWRALKRTMKAADLPRGTLHTFRHVFCSFAANNNIPAFQVMKILGHGSLEIVLIYYHVDDDELFRSVNDVQFDNLLKIEIKEEN